MFNIKKYFLTILGLGFVGIGMVGAVLPVLPTVPFLILALWCFAGSSDRFHNWLYNHKVWGPQLQLWKQYNVIPPMAKITALSSMSLSLAFLVFFSEISEIGLGCTAAIMLYGAYYILSKPSYPPEC